MKKNLRELIVAKKISRFSRHLIPATFNVLRIFFFLNFSYKVSKNDPFLNFLSPYFLNFMGIFYVCDNKLQDFCSIKCIISRIFSVFPQFATLNSRGNLILEFLQRFGTFCLKFEKTFLETVAKFSSRDIFFLLIISKISTWLTRVFH